MQEIQTIIVRCRPMCEEEKTNGWPWVPGSNQVLEAKGETSQNSTIFSFFEHTLYSPTSDRVPVCVLEYEQLD